ncbi:hypothetical protein [Kitasatospora sp. NPDC004272]
MPLGVREPDHAQAEDGDHGEAAADDPDRGRGSRTGPRPRVPGEQIEDPLEMPRKSTATSRPPPIAAANHSTVSTERITGNSEVVEELTP